MKLTRRKIILFVVAFLLIAVFCLFPRTTGRGDNIKIVKIRNGFKCIGKEFWHDPDSPIQQTAIPLTIDPVILGNGRIAFVEEFWPDYPVNRFIFNLFKIRLKKPEDFWRRYYIRVLNLTNSKNAYEYDVTYHEIPVMAFNIFEYNGYLIVHHNDELPGASDENGVYPITVLSASGKVINQFLISLNLLPLGVDGKNNLLILSSLQYEEKYGLSVLNGFQFIDLPSGQMKFDLKDMTFIAASTDGAGNIFTINIDGTIEKYSITPWAKIWASTARMKKIPDSLKYSDGKLIAFFLKQGDKYYTEIETEGILIDPDNGGIIQENYIFNPHSTEAEFKGKKYRMTHYLNEISVERIEGDASN